MTTPLMRYLLPLLLPVCLTAAERPNIILLMTDDQGWGQTGYRDHPHLETPNLDAMASGGLRFEHFYAGASNCSPTRATVLTGRSNDRTGVRNHGYALRLQEKTVAQALRRSGYATAHFGKWHLNGLRGPGVPIFATDSHNPGRFGFETWLSVSNFFDRDPLMSRQGKVESFEGDSSEIIVAEALEYIRGQGSTERPFFVVIWYGTPHSPMIVSEADRSRFPDDLTEKHRHHLGELVAMDRSVGALRSGLRELGLAENTLLWFNSDNGGLPGYGPETVGHLRGSKSSMYEGGLRVPGIVEWPAVIRSPRVTRVRAGTVDIFPTLVEVAGLPATAMLRPVDGISLKGLFEREWERRPDPLFFHHNNRGVVIDGDRKLLVTTRGNEVYHLVEDPAETRNLFRESDPESRRLMELYRKWKVSLDASREGLDYPEGKVLPGNPEPRQWREDPVYRPWLERFQRNVHPQG